MTTYVPIARRFALAEKEELRDPDFSSYFSHEPDGIYRWQDLLEMTPVVILGEGRSGKTREFQEQVDILKSSGRFAFFLPLERLHDENLESVLIDEDIEDFEAWKVSNSQVGYFFLDALDELKLREGSLRAAVKKLRLGCEPHLARMRLIVSCRPADWQSQIDSRHLEPFCVAQACSLKVLGEFQTSDKQQKIYSFGSGRGWEPKNTLIRIYDWLKSAFTRSVSGCSSGDRYGSKEFFLEVISRSDAVQGELTSSHKDDQGEERNSPTVVALLPLSQSEVKEFSGNYAPEHSGSFCDHLETYDLWHLYRLPAEIVDALDQMVTGVPLGTMQEQLRLGIQRKLREEQKNKRRALSVERAQEGAERIALALFLLKRRTVKVEDSDDQERLDIGDILTDWTFEEQQELIGKSLFDPSGVGSVRFHHRATQEYLAAMRLHHIRERGMHERDLFALLFSEIGGEEVVKPSMAPVAAWLALWHGDIRRLLLEREPGLLFRQGLPSALSMEVRAEVLRAYIPYYAGKGWCRAGIGHEELRRVAHPNLGSLVRELWKDAYTGHDSRELLLEMIWLAPMPDCTDLSLTAALDDALGPDHRTYASWGVLAAGTSDQKRTLAEAVLNAALPQRVIRNILPEAVPFLINIDDFLTIVAELDLVPNSIHGLNYTIYRTVKSEALNREERTTLRDRLADAIWSTRLPNCQMYNAQSEKDHYRDALMASCSETMPYGDGDCSAWAWALAVAVHFGERHESIIARKETEAIWSALNDSLGLREAYFWACLALADGVESQEGDWPRFIRAFSETRRSLYCNDGDQQWLLNAVGPETSDDRRGVVFQALIYFFDLRQDYELAEAIEARVGDRDDWLKILHNVRNPQPLPPNEWEIRNEEIRTERKRKEEKRLADWLAWRTEVLGDQDYLMGGDRRLSVLLDANKVIKQGASRDSTWGHWDSSIVARALGAGFLDRYRQELSVFWRETDVRLRSERTTEERNSYPQTWLLALVAVKAEAEAINWPASLSDDDAVKATRIACIELNGFGAYVSELDEVHPRAVAGVVADEALAQLQLLQEVGQAEIFHDVLYHGTVNMKVAVASRIASYVSDFLSVENDGAKNALEYAIRIIAENGNVEDRRLAIDSLEEAVEKGASSQIGFVIWLISNLDPEIGCQHLLDVTEDLSSLEKRRNAISVFAAVFGDRHSRHVPDLLAIHRDRTPFLLKKLVLRAYQVVRREDDIGHEGTYSPCLRDNAQDARSFLLESFFTIKSTETLAAMHELAEKPEFSHMSDRLHQMAYETAAQISDMTAYPLAAFQVMDRDGAFIPVDHRSLLTAMMTRLDSFERDILHAEDTPIEALRRLDQETDLRRFITNWLRGRDRGVFDFTQEAVVVDENRTDIRFHPRSMQGYATVELKRETWSVRELETALSKQFVGQYLQHENCRAGCLLICMAKRKSWKHPGTGAMMSLREVIDHLGIIARKIMEERPELHIAVKGIDYS